MEDRVQYISNKLRMWTQGRGKHETKLPSEVTEMLTDDPAIKNSLLNYQREVDQATILHLMVRNRTISVVQLSKITTKQNIYMKDVEGECPLSLIMQLYPESKTELYTNYLEEVIIKGPISWDVTGVHGQNMAYLAVERDFNVTLERILKARPALALALTPQRVSLIQIGVVRRSLRCLKFLCSLPQNNINIQSTIYDSPIHSAIESKCPELIRLVLSFKGIDLTIVNSYGFTPLHEALNTRQLCYGVIEEIVKQAKARPVPIVQLPLIDVMLVRCEVDELEYNGLTSLGCLLWKLDLTNRDLRLVRLLLAEGFGEMERDVDSHTVNTIQVALGQYLAVPSLLREQLVDELWLANLPLNYPQMVNLCFRKTSLVGMKKMCQLGEWPSLLSLVQFYNLRRCDIDLLSQLKVPPLHSPTPTKSEYQLVLEKLQSLDEELEWLTPGEGATKLMLRELSGTALTPTFRQMRDLYLPPGNHVMAE